MLAGQVEKKISVKRQVAFPKKFRDILGLSILITKGPSSNLIAVAEKNLLALLDGTESKPFINKNARDMQTFILANAEEVHFDDQGRFVLPEHLVKHAGITDRVIFAGVNTYVQIWDKKAWEDYQEYLATNIDPITEKLSLE